ncbi:MAG: hypothetical protein H0U76_02735 [Ktedonobacteraceae bacterium]|nr:hypothetical protein [Ktedonobacteraceae bacterium]MBA3822863.1 hypothetical protein [Ktedonobacterales bacterium]
MPVSQQDTNDEFDLELHLSDDEPLEDVTTAQASTDCCVTYTATTGNRTTHCCAC